MKIKTDLPGIPVQVCFLLGFDKVIPQHAKAVQHRLIEQIDHQRVVVEEI